MPNSAAERYRTNYLEEREAAALYRQLAEAEKDPNLASVYRQLAEMEDRHAAVWEARLRELGEPLPPPGMRWRARLIAWLAKRFGAGAVVPMLLTSEQDAGRSYLHQPEARAAGMPAQERTHFHVFRTLTAPGGLGGPAVALLEGRHRSAGGNALRAAVLGANDGLVSNFSLVMGVAGATLESSSVLVAGFAGLLAGALSMALGEWLSVQSARELYSRQIAIEREELEVSPEEEAAELALIYQAKGIPREQAERLAQSIVAAPETALETLSREELGIDPEELGGSAWVAAGASFLLFAIGAVIPLFGFLFANGLTAVALSAIASAVGLFVIGAGITLFTGRSIWYSGLRQVLFGAVAAAITFGIGSLVGVGLGL
ncbi:MAG: VIT1/CCC1 family protein [Chloroflexota bacterium]|nr:VIT1/CCC1 family protein [Dehalococcoidia bacterium]MDW8254042.1 VIT1/CCC1 family protein [Chloroflexota bacterium]